MKKAAMIVLVALIAGSGVYAQEWFGHMVEMFCKYDPLIAEAEKSPKKIAATSRLPEGKKYSYAPENLRDLNPQSAWCTRGYEPGKYKADFIVMKIPKGAQGIRITNGYAKSEKAFENNNRVKQIYLSFNVYDPEVHQDCEPKSNYWTLHHTAREAVNLTDSMNSQNIIFSDLKRFKWSRFKQDDIYLGIGIVDIYPGKKWNDTCLTEIEIIL